MRCDSWWWRRMAQESSNGGQISTFRDFEAQLALTSFGSDLNGSVLLFGDLTLTERSKLSAERVFGATKFASLPGDIGLLMLAGVPGTACGAVATPGNRQEGERRASFSHHVEVWRNWHASSSHSPTTSSLLVWTSSQSSSCGDELPPCPMPLVLRSSRLVLASLLDRTDCKRDVILALASD